MLSNQKKHLAFLIMAIGFASGSSSYGVDLLYASLGTGNVVTFDVSLSTSAAIAASKTNFVTGIGDPMGLVFDSSSNLYIASATFNTITKATPAGSTSTFANVGSPKQPNGLVMDSSGNIYSANQQDSTISKITPAGVVSTYVASTAGLNRPYGLAIDPAGNLYSPNSLSTTVSKIDTSGNVSTFATGLTNPNSVLYGNDGYLYVTNDNSTLSRVNSSGTVSTFVAAGGSNGLNRPVGMVFDNAGNLYVANPNSLKISKYDPNGNLLLSFSTGTGLASPFFLAFAPSSVPEPSTYALAAIASGVLGFAARRRKANKA